MTANAKFVKGALDAFESALKSKEGPLFPIQAELAMLRSRYESESRKWDESLRLAHSHDKTLHGDRDDPQKTPGIVNCLRSIRETLDANSERHKRNSKVFWSALITTVVSLVIQAIWIAFHLPATLKP